MLLALEYHNCEVLQLAILVDYLQYDLSIPLSHPIENLARAGRSEKEKSLLSCISYSHLLLYMNGVTKLRQGHT